MFSSYGQTRIKRTPYKGITSPVFSYISQVSEERCGLCDPLNSIINIAYSQNYVRKLNQCVCVYLLYLKKKIDEGNLFYIYTRYNLKFI